MNCIPPEENMFCTQSLSVRRRVSELANIFITFVHDGRVHFAFRPRKMASMNQKENQPLSPLDREYLYWTIVGKIATDNWS